jgi:Kae1-associated kinase Bud32
MELIGHGAEAKVYKVTKGDISTVVKERLPKKYRHPELDKKINISRLRSEVKIMKKLESKGVRVPRLISVDEGNCSIEMEFIEGKQVKDYINDPATSP